MERKDRNETSEVRLLDESTRPIERLNGFQKFHRIPDSSSVSNLQFLHQIATEDLETDLQKTFANLKKAFRFKRREIAVSGPLDGGGMIETPFFNYEINVLFSEHDNSRMVSRAAISNIREPNQVLSEAFQQTFGNRFSILEVSTSSPLNIGAIIDHVEDSNIESATVDYDKDVTWCEIRVPNVQACVKIRNNSIRIVRLVESSPQRLLETYQEIQQQFLASLDCGGNPFMADSP